MDKREEERIRRGAERLSEAVRQGLVTAEEAQRVLDLVQPKDEEPLDTLTDEA